VRDLQPFFGPLRAARPRAANGVLARAGPLPWSAAAAETTGGPYRTMTTPLEEGVVVHAPRLVDAVDLNCDE
jgi:hypothetical protein